MKMLNTDHTYVNNLLKDYSIPTPTYNKQYDAWVWLNTQHIIILSMRKNTVGVEELFPLIPSGQNTYVFTKKGRKLIAEKILRML